MHLDGGFAGVPARVMRKAVKRKVAVELPIDPRQKIEIEGRRHALAIIIGVDQPSDVLLEIDADDGLSLLPDMAPEPAQEGGGLGMVQIADGRTGKKSGFAPGRQIGQLEIVVEVGDNR